MPDASGQVTLAPSCGQRQQTLTFGYRTFDGRGLPLRTVACVSNCIRFLSAILNYTAFKPVKPGKGSFECAFDSPEIYIPIKGSITLRRSKRVANLHIINS